MKIKNLLLAILLIPSVASAADSSIPLPKGWAISPGIDKQVTGDFDGNEINDVARIVKSKDKEAVYVTLISADKTVRHVKVADLDSKEQISIKMRKGFLIPGIRIGCIKGEKDAGDDRSKNLCTPECECKNILTEGDIIVGTSGTSTWYWYWNGSKFNLIWGKM